MKDLRTFLPVIRVKLLNVYRIKIFPAKILQKHETHMLCPTQLRIVFKTNVERTRQSRYALRAILKLLKRTNVIVFRQCGVL
jgi:hypothetical protein